jgi:AraC-like DNA-binding protein
MNAPVKLPALAQEVAELEATFLEVLACLRASRPDLASELDDAGDGLATRTASRKTSSPAIHDISTQSVTENRSLDRFSEERDMKIDSNGKVELAEAANATLREIARLAAKAPPRIAAMLDYIHKNLFDPQLSVHRIKDACQLRDNSIALHFHRVLGQPPGTFITDRRLEVAERLLANTWLPIWKITELLGYSSIQVFSRAYFRRKGRRPSVIRKEGPIQSVPVETAAPAPATAPPRPREGDLLQRALAGHLDDHEAASLICRLLEIYPPQRRIAAVSP